MSPVDRTLAVPELLENILLQLPLRHLLRANAVCKTWQDSMQASIKIRRALFLAPAEDKSLRLVRSANDYEWAGPDGDKSFVPIINPFLAVGYQGYEDIYNRQWYAGKTVGLYLGGDEAFFFNEIREFISEYCFNDSFKYPSELDLDRSSGSFKKMNATQPPVTPTSKEDKSGERLSLYDLFKDIIQACRPAEESEDESEPCYALCDAWDTLIMLSRSVDEITGWEMVGILKMSVEELEQRGLVYYETYERPIAQERYM